MKRALVELVAQVAVLAVVFLVIAAGALFFGVTTGAIGNALAPDFHIQMADRLGWCARKGRRRAFVTIAS